MNKDADFQKVIDSINKRQTALTVRSAIVSFMYLFLIIATFNFVYYILPSHNLNSDFISGTDKLILTLGIPIGFLGLVFAYMFVRFINKIEQGLWIDSDADGRDISSKHSWKIALRIVLPALKTFMYVLWRSFPELLIWSLILPAVYYQYFTPSIGLTAGLLWFTFLWIGTLIAFYNYVVKEKIQFTPFAFIDFYNKKNFSVSKIYSEIKKLNTVSKTEDFRKLLKENWSSDSLVGISDRICKVTLTRTRDYSKAIPPLFPNWAGLGGLFTSMARGTIQEGGRNALSFSRTAALYIIYRDARRAVYGEEQEVNEYIYNLY